MKINNKIKIKDLQQTGLLVEITIIIIIINNINNINQCIKILNLSLLHKVMNLWEITILLTSQVICFNKTGIIRIIIYNKADRCITIVGVKYTESNKIKIPIIIIM